MDFHVVSAAIKLTLRPHPTSRSFFRLQAKLQDHTQQVDGLSGQFEFLTSKDFRNVLPHQLLGQRRFLVMTYDITKVCVDCSLDETCEYCDWVECAFGEVSGMLASYLAASPRFHVHLIPSRMSDYITARSSCPCSSSIPSPSSVGLRPKRLTGTSN